jgi:hypothetical protein
MDFLQPADWKRAAGGSSSFMRAPSWSRGDRRPARLGLLRAQRASALRSTDERTPIVR